MGDDIALSIVGKRIRLQFESCPYLKRTLKIWDGISWILISYSLERVGSLLIKHYNLKVTVSNFKIINKTIILVPWVSLCMLVFIDRWVVFECILINKNVNIV